MAPLTSPPSNDSSPSAPASVSSSTSSTVSTSAAASVADLFSEDGAWRWPEGDRLVEGRAGPARVLRRAPRGPALAPHDGERPGHRGSTHRGAGHLVLHHLPGRQPHRRHGPGRTSCADRHDEDTFRRVDGTWLLSTRTLFLPFGGPTPRQRPSAARSSSSSTPSHVLVRRAVGAVADLGADAQFVERRWRGGRASPSGPGR